MKTCKTSEDIRALLERSIQVKMSYDFSLRECVYTVHSSALGGNLYCITESEARKMLDENLQGDL